MTDSPTDPQRALQACESALERITHDVGLVVDRELGLTDFRSELAWSRPAGEGVVHLSFRVRVTHGDRVGHGALLMPVPHASGLAASLMMMPESKVDEAREQDVPDRATKDAMLELGAFVAGAIGDEWNDLTGAGFRVEPAGCQGVRAGVRPAFEYTEGDDLWVARARCAIGAWEAGDWLLVLPAMPEGFATTEESAPVADADVAEAA